MNATTKLLGLNPRWARSPWTTNCSTPRSPPWRANTLWPEGGRDDEPDGLALPVSLIWPGGGLARVGCFARGGLWFSQGDELAPPDADLADHIRREIEASDFHGEGYRKI